MAHPLPLLLLDYAPPLFLLYTHNSHPDPRLCLEGGWRISYDSTTTMKTRRRKVCLLLWLLDKRFLQSNPLIQSLTFLLLFLLLPLSLSRSLQSRAINLPPILLLISYSSHSKFCRCVCDIRSLEMKSSHCSS